MAKLRALVADDSETARKRIVESLAADPAIEVVGEAEDGQRVIELCLNLRPDVITMDMMMPIMTGVAATEYIMAHQPTPILIVSSSFNRGELFKIYDALAAGAVDVLEKPTGEEPEGEWECRLVAAVKLVSRIKVITHPRGRLGLERSRRLESAAFDRGRGPVSQLEVIAIGASTGGPGAILEVLRKLPASFQVPILVVLHMNEPFGAAFIDWLDAQINRPVSAAQDGVRVETAKGRVLVAPCGKHLVIRDRATYLTLGPERHSCRPSVDTLFESIAPEYGQAAAACLLTGMGKDGALGLLRIREAGGITIAQDEASSIVYGMPREAVLLGAALQVLPIGEIGPRIAASQTARMEALA